jgi:hypothetical protein
MRFYRGHMDVGEDGFRSSLLSIYCRIPLQPPVPHTKQTKALVVSEVYVTLITNNTCVNRLCRRVQGNTGTSTELEL